MLVVEPIHQLAYESICGYSLGYDAQFYTSFNDIKKLFKQYANEKDFIYGWSRATQAAVIEFEVDRQGQITKLLTLTKITGKEKSYAVAKNGKTAQKEYVPVFEKNRIRCSDVSSGALEELNRQFQAAYNRPALLNKDVKQNTASKMVNAMKANSLLWLVPLVILLSVTVSPMFALKIGASLWIANRIYGVVQEEFDESAYGDILKNKEAISTLDAKSSQALETGIRCGNDWKAWSSHLMNCIEQAFDLRKKKIHYAKKLNNTITTERHYSSTLRPWIGLFLSNFCAT